MSTGCLRMFDGSLTLLHVWQNTLWGVYFSSQTTNKRYEKFTAMCKYMANKYVCCIFACLFSYVLCLNYEVKNHSLHFGISSISKDIKNGFCQSSKRIQGVPSEKAQMSFQNMTSYQKMTSFVVNTNYYPTLCIPM